MEIVATLVRTVHVLVAALWLGAMTYSLLVIQPRLRTLTGADPQRLEEAQRVLAQGNRWPVAALITALWASGLALLIVPGAAASIGWVVAVKVGLLAGASVLFWWVSWRGWPRRVFAHPEELPALQRRFGRVAVAMATLVGIAFVLAVVA
ncbi:hypothetical protein RIF23_02155 [Lipingzhangella sp. LS1_29]|uniref:Copper resistance protein D n=1 Tax=Lipingzhangella rawalii TaxID=2055835 RepID=A0ABU2H2J7_9ACTN|nr:hypothetical protein [Lipingzhangella rawalii]MDS1269094.1 hypothetical protein [Lipingzhangella rawalii]